MNVKQLCVLTSKKVTFGSRPFLLISHSPATFPLHLTLDSCLLNPYNTSTMSCLSQLTSLLGLEHAASSSSDNAPVDLLMLGTGWTGTFLLPAAGSASLRIAHTTRDGGQGSIPFAFDPDSDDIQAFEALPDATTVLIVFPLYTEAAVKRLIAGYLSTRKAQEDNDNDEKKQKSRFILLGSTGIWDVSVQAGSLFVWGKLY